MTINHRSAWNQVSTIEDPQARMSRAIFAFQPQYEVKGGQNRDMMWKTMFPARSLSPSVLVLWDVVSSQRWELELWLQSCCAEEFVHIWPVPQEQLLTPSEMQVLIQHLNPFHPHGSHSLCFLTPLIAPQNTIVWMFSHPTSIVCLRTHFFVTSHDKNAVEPWRTLLEGRRESEIRDWSEYLTKSK